ERMVRVPAGEEALKAQPWMAGDHFAQLRDAALGDTARGFMRKRFGAEAELEDDFRAAKLQFGKERFVDIGSVDVPFGSARFFPALQRSFHFDLADDAVIDIGGKMSGGREGLRNASNVVIDGRMDIVEVANGSVGKRAAATADG